MQKCAIIWLQMMATDEIDDHIIQSEYKCTSGLQNPKGKNSTLGITSAWRNCVGCDIVQADHAPEAGVAQGIFHGILVRHQGEHQEEVEERLEEEVERRVKGEHSSNQTQVRMHG